jgi:YaiO family outer membrane protein
MLTVVTSVRSSSEWARGVSYVAVLVLGVAPAAALAQTVAREPELRAAPPNERSAEIGAFAESVSSGYDGWQGSFARVRAPLTSSTHATIDILAQSAFGDAGEYGALTVRQSIASAFVVASLGGGTGRFVLPRERADLLVGTTLGARRSLVVALGAGYVRAQDVYTDRALVTSLAWYATPGLVLEIGGRLNASRPGAVHSHRVSGAATLLPNGGRDMIVARIDVGTEGYELLARAPVVARGFTSSGVAVALRHRASRRWGESVELEGYHNPYYTRAGLRAGVVHFW